MVETRKETLCYTYASENVREKGATTAFKSKSSGKQEVEMGFYLNLSEILRSLKKG